MVEAEFWVVEFEFLSWFSQFTVISSAFCLGPAENSESISEDGHGEGEDYRRSASSADVGFDDITETDEALFLDGGLNLVLEDVNSLKDTQVAISVFIW